ncbi:MAG TPA: cell division protein ZapA [Desulfotignum sp.]|nr:cell division protein ZapA [Desulfotignum sp.]
MNEIIKIDLFGEEFRFKPDGEVKNPEKVAQHLTDYIQEAEEMFQSKSSGRNKIAILLLAAMNLSKDFHELKLQHSEFKRDVGEKMASLINKIDEELE